jgi:hypothetical protein
MHAEEGHGGIVCGCASLTGCEIETLYAIAQSAQIAENSIKEIICSIIASKTAKFT